MAEEHRSSADSKKNKSEIVRAKWPPQKIIFKLKSDNFEPVFKEIDKMVPEDQFNQLQFNLIIAVKNGLFLGKPLQAQRLVVGSIERFWKLVEANPDRATGSIFTKQLSTLLFKAGELVEEGRDSVPLDQRERLHSKKISDLLALCDDTEHAICNAIKGAGLLAHNIRLQGSINSKVINRLLTRQLSLKPDHANVFIYSLVGLAYMAINGHLKKASVETKLLHEMLAILVSFLQKGVSKFSTSSNPKNIIFNFADVFFGFGNIAASSCLNKKLDTQLIPVNSWLSALYNLLKYSKEPETHKISKVFEGAGLLASSDCLQENAEVATINSLHSKFNSLMLGTFDARATRATDDDTRATDSCRSLLGLGDLAASGRLDGPVEAEDIGNSLVNLNRLTDQPGSYNGRRLAEGLLGLSFLMAAARVSGRLDVTPINMLLDKLNAAVESLGADRGRVIAGILWAMCYFASHNGFRGKLKAGVINSLLNSLNSYQPRPAANHIAAALLGAGYLTADTVEGGLNCMAIENLLFTLDNLTGALAPSAEHISSALFGAAKVWVNLKHQLSPREDEIIKSLLSKISTMLRLDGEDIQLKQFFEMTGYKMPQAVAAETYSSLPSTVPVQASFAKPADRPDDRKKRRREEDDETFAVSDKRVSLYNGYGGAGFLRPPVSKPGDNRTDSSTIPRRGF